MGGGIKIIAGDGVGGKGVGLRAVFGQLLKGIALLGVEHLMLQIVGDARRSIQPLAVQAETGIHAAVAGGEKGIALGIVPLGHDVDAQAVGQRLPADGLADALVKGLFHACASFPFRKYTVSRDTVAMASKIRWRETSRTWRASSSGVSSWPVAACPI